MQLDIDYNDISGREKVGYSLLQPLEQKILKKFLPLVPPFIETYHLTLLTIPLCLIMFAAGWLARNNYTWLWVNSLVILTKYVADFFDGALGRYRETGLVKWGFYMDHFLDFVFGCCAVASYALVFEASTPLFVFFLVVLIGYFMHELLTCISLGRYNVRGYYGVGPAELMVLFFIGSIGVNLLRPTDPKPFLAVLGLGMAALLVSRVYRIQKRLWKIDMQIKAAQEGESSF